MFENAEGHLIDAVLTEISLQIVRSPTLPCCRATWSVRATGSSFNRPPASNSSKATPHGSILHGIERKQVDCDAARAAREARAAAYPP